MQLTWHVARTATRLETRAERGLQEQGFLVYLPRRIRKVRHARRTEAKAVPLFPGYLFVAVTAEEQWAQVNDTDGVHRLLTGSGENGPPAKIPSSWIVALLVEELFGAFDQSRGSQKRFTGSQGMKVEITGGHFIGRLATLIGEAGPTDRQVRVELHGIGGGKMKVDTGQLKAA